MEKKQKSKEVKIASEKTLYHCGALMFGFPIGSFIMALIDDFLFMYLTNRVHIIACIHIFFESSLLYVIRDILKISLLIQ